MFDLLHVRDEKEEFKERLKFATSILLLLLIRFVVESAPEEEEKAILILVFFLDHMQKTQDCSTTTNWEKNKVI